MGKQQIFYINIKNNLTTKELLSHLYVLIPALDNDKHYFVSENEIEKLLEKGEGWLKEHPERELIIRRYLINISSLSRRAIERISEGEVKENLGDDSSENTEIQKRRETLHDKRITLVAQKIIESKRKVAF